MALPRVQGTGSDTPADSGGFQAAAVASVITARFPSLRDKRVIVTGGATGIGEGIVEAFALQGAQVGFVDILAAPSHDLVARLAHAPHAPRFCEQDVAQASSLTAAIGDLIAQLGGCDVLVNNAASDDRHALDAVTPSYWDERLAVNLKHKFFASQAAWPAMKANGGGVILNLGSISWHLGLEDLALYQVAKAGVEGLTRSLARELGPYNIRVNTIIPGNVQTERQMRWYTPDGEAQIVAAQCLKGRLQPADIAAMALFLASDEARFCTGHEYWVDGGWR
ncbi:SDR family NAD(P)-dependent oxidoreductase [Novosphingobium huizhouense]|uniref:SDR family NAD(P)-dependent oxidoreductase n=1 Tax=Novosphingobium huizhouense TaxID=2866625 RepID=UPI001CD8358F|nr:SDR family oxidoreductase [Novosphingobium huizhouense]